MLADAYTVATAPSAPCERVPVWIFDFWLRKSSCVREVPPGRLRESVRRNATMVRMAAANGPALATDVMDVE